MRISTALIVSIFLTLSLGSAHAAPKPPPPPPVNGSGTTVDVAADRPELALPDFHGMPVINWLPQGGWTGFSFEANPAFDAPLMYAFVRRLGGMPTRDKRRAQLFAAWSFSCEDPRISQAEIGYGSRRRQGGVQLVNMKFTAHVTVSFYKCRPATPDDYDPENLGVVCGDSEVDFTGEGKANALVVWRASYNTNGWTPGPNIAFGQSETGIVGLQKKAVIEAFKNLKPPALTPLPY